MPYIYKYVNHNTQDVEYVGIINKDSNFPKRFDQHKRDYWYEPFKYDIYYAQVQSQTDAEALEGHFISFYGSDRYHNKAKVGWGECSFAPDVEWRRFDDTIDADTHINAYRDYLWKKAKAIQLQMLESQKELDKLTDQILRVNEEDKKLSRKSVRKWFSSNFAISHPPYKCKYATKDDLFESYCEFAESDPEMVQFSDADDFWDVLGDIKEYYRNIDGDTMYNLLEREEYSKEVALSMTQQTRINKEA